MSLAVQVVRFARVLRRAGLPVGTDQVLAALRALEACGPGRRDDLRAVLAALFLGRREHAEVFHEAFDLFWRAPAAQTPPAGTESPGEAGPASPARRRVLEALAAEAVAGAATRPAPPPAGEVTALLPSSRERLRHMDFASLSAAELEQAREALARLRWPVPDLPVRRHAPAAHGPQVDPRASLRAALRGPPDFLPLCRSRRRTRPAPLVVLCDISGSMRPYARMFLHFLHALVTDRERVHVFLFGTRLTPVTRHLRHRDPDTALRALATVVADWSGGTRIAASLARFNRQWSRRVLGQGASVLLLSDGLDRDEDGHLGAEAERLRKSCRQILWLNPLLRFPGFEPRAAGIRALLPHVDRFLPAHNVDSLERLARTLAAERPVR